MLGGIDTEGFRSLLDAGEPNRYDRRALITVIARAPTTEIIVDQIIDLFAETARRLWPIWFTDVSFDHCRNDTLGRAAANLIARGAAGEIRGLSIAWTEEAAAPIPPRLRAPMPDKKRST